MLHHLIDMDKVVGALAQMGDLQVRNDDDFVDRLSRRYTTLFLVLFAILVSTKQYVGEPISCWVPARFSENHEDYANKVCWVSNTYYLPFSENIVDAKTPKLKIQYYQWVPMILLAQSLLFFVPCIAWRLLSKRSGLSIKAILDAALTCQRSGIMGESRDKSLRFMIGHLDSYFGMKKPAAKGMMGRLKRVLANRCFCICGRRYGNYIITVYLFTKLLYVINSIGQLFALDLFLGTDYHLFGFHVVLSLIKGKTWAPTERFPKVTLCDFDVRELANVNRHTVQCVLPINLFNEKIYVFIWFWFVFIGLISLLSLFQWFGKSYFRSSQVEYIRKQLKVLDRINRETDGHATKFTTEYLSQDGVFVLRLVAINAGDLIAAELTAGLFDTYNKNMRLIVDNSDNVQNNTGIAL